MSSGARAVFSHRDFRLYWIAIFAEGFGLTMALVAIGWQVYSVRGNALDLGLVGLAEFLPLLLFALPAGQLADRVSRRRLLVVMVVLDIVMLGGLLVVTVSGADEVWPFFALAFLFGTSSALGAPAGRALTPSLVPEELLVSALAQRSIVNQISLVSGPAVGGLLFAVRAELVYAIAIALALVSLVCFLSLRTGRMPAAEGVEGLNEVLAGVRHIRRTNVLLGAISLDLFAVLLGGLAADLGIGAGAEATRERPADVELHVGVGHEQGLGVGVHRDELDALEPGVDHPIDRVHAAATDADDLDHRQVVLRVGHWVCLPSM